MLFYVQMKWNYQGRISQDQLWDLESLEGVHGIEGIRSGFVQLYKVVSQHRIIAIVNADSLENLDRNSMGWLPMREYLEFEHVWALRDYEGFLEDVKAKFQRPPATGASATGGTGGDAPGSSSSATCKVIERWFNALKSGNLAEALSCLDDKVTWINNPGEKGLSTIVPWLGEYHGRKAVGETFTIWAQLVDPTAYAIEKIVVDGDEGFALVREGATVKATGQSYDFEIVYRMRVADGRIAYVKAFWDSTTAVVPFRGDMPARLIKAAETNNCDEAMKVLPFGGDANTVDHATGLSVLMVAAARGHAGMVRTLLDFGADPNALDRRAGTTALHKACQGDHLDIARMLVEAGAYVDVLATTTGHSPLIEAIWFKADDIVEYLLDHDARVDLKTYYGFTIDDHINYALNVSKGVSDQQKLARIKQLVQRRRERDQAARDGAVLIQAVQRKDTAMLSGALRDGAPTERRWPIVTSFDDGHTALLVAARDGQTDMVGELVKARADVNAIEPVFGAVPLHKATYNGQQEITRILAAAPGVNLDYQGPSNGYTPLHDALWHGFAECAETLLDAGARTDIVAYDGKLAVDLAAEKLGNDHPLTRRLRSAAARPA